MTVTIQIPSDVEAGRVAQARADSPFITGEVIYECSLPVFGIAEDL
jgi:hypothetical protein